MQTSTSTNRYTDSDLQEFKAVILNKMAVAKEELETLTASLSNNNPNGTDDTGGAYHSIDDGTATLEKETIHQMAARQKKFIEQLDAALARIGNKTYGIFRATGKLIEKQRLMAVPHTTLSMEAKLRQN
jgi:RNA polymerase-binding transcription factor DksA